MSHIYKGIDTSPLVLTLEDNKVGYFYSPQQLEAIRERQMSRLEHVEFIKSLNGHSNVMERK